MLSEWEWHGAYDGVGVGADDVLQVGPRCLGVRELLLLQLLLDLGRHAVALLQPLLVHPGHLVQQRPPRQLQQSAINFYWSSRYYCTRPAIRHARVDY